MFTMLLCVFYYGTMTRESTAGSANSQKYDRCTNYFDLNESQPCVLKLELDVEPVFFGFLH